MKRPFVSAALFEGRLFLTTLVRRGEETCATWSWDLDSSQENRSAVALDLAGLTFVCTHLDERRLLDHNLELG